MKARLSRRHADDPDAFVVEELPVGRGDGRLDLAVVNGRIEGVEIKSCLDTLERLPRQIGLYGESVDAMTLVVARRHLDAAICIVPNWWQVFEATPGARGGTGLRRVRQGRRNPKRNTMGMLRMLEREELLSILALNGLDRGWRSSSWQALAERVSLEIRASAIAAEVRRQLKLRVLLEARFGCTAFGSTAAGGGTLRSPLLAFTFS